MNEKTPESAIYSGMKPEEILAGVLRLEGLAGLTAAREVAAKMAEALRLGGWLNEARRKQ